MTKTSVLSEKKTYLHLIATVPKNHLYCFDYSVAKKKNEIEVTKKCILQKLQTKVDIP